MMAWGVRAGHAGLMAVQPRAGDPWVAEEAPLRAGQAIKRTPSQQQAAWELVMLIACRSKPHALPIAPARVMDAPGRSFLVVPPCSQAPAPSPTASNAMSVNFSQQTPPPSQTSSAAVGPFASQRACSLDPLLPAPRRHKKKLTTITALSVPSQSLPAGAEDDPTQPNPTPQSVALSRST
ncbi:hypothetical protein Purlil1_3813 [Purpureocillium lilacinum]|uniref:Uncharacterized protein n=1 Tax=Purpureocillium lilacinum TaxID=33203 RepID=A0ABR0C732_PURLI|nr:hypothetical protein Purlil1_3813 [Purpureocillium lilacinum]